MFEEVGGRLAREAELTALSGDPYFLRIADGAIVRVPHAAVMDDVLDEAQVELVASSGEELFARANLNDYRMTSKP